MSCSLCRAEHRTLLINRGGFRNEGHLGFIIGKMQDNSYFFAFVVDCDIVPYMIEIGEKWARMRLLYV